MAFELNYKEAISLDAEDLAETGIKQAYERLLPVLRRYVSSPAEMDELINNDLPSYSVRCLDTEYVIYSPDEDRSWHTATFAFFDIVNRQLAGTKYRFFAINGGNDLFGMFLTAEQAEAAKTSIEREEDWPYLPTSPTT